MPTPLAIIFPIMIPLVLGTITGIVATNQLNEAPPPPPRIRELPQSGLTSYTIRPQYRLNNKLLNVFNRAGERVFRIIRHNGGDSEQGVIFSIMGPVSSRPIVTVRINGLKSEILFHAQDDKLHSLGLVSIRHVVAGVGHYRMFILPDGNTYQWTGSTRHLERVFDKGGTMNTEIRERIACARRIGTRIWELKFDEQRICGEIVVATALVSILDQWNTIFGVGGIFMKSEKNLTVKFKE
ncbi:hypothetical protein V1514DRAFT_44240 [Lipomyces japonicus]|uniref:uncharacterized protein n=1 Tax=Lipomyces japonicus TaxID=56871 RepID=UPI0034CD03E3